MKKNPIDVVELLNEKLSQSTDYDFMNYFTYTTTGMHESITLYAYVLDFEIKIDIWDSESDNRKFIEEVNDYEPLEDFILKTLNDCIKKLQELKEILS